MGFPVERSRECWQKNGVNETECARSRGHYWSRTECQERRRISRIPSMQKAIFNARCSHFFRGKWGINSTRLVKIFVPGESPPRRPLSASLDCLQTDPLDWSLPPPEERSTAQNNEMKNMEYYGQITSGIAASSFCKMLSVLTIFELATLLLTVSQDFINEHLRRLT